MGGGSGSSVVCCMPKCELSLRHLLSFGASRLLFAQSDRIEVLEKERSWKEEEFDFVLQFLRTVLLKRKILRNVLGYLANRSCRWRISHLHDTFGV